MPNDAVESAFAMPGINIASFFIEAGGGVIVVQEGRKGVIFPINARVYYDLVAESIAVLKGKTDMSIAEITGAPPSYANQLRDMVIGKMERQLALAKTSSELYPGIVQNENGAIVATGKRVVRGTTNKVSRQRMLVGSLPVGNFAAYPLSGGDKIFRKNGPLTLYENSSAEKYVTVRDITTKDTVDETFVIILEDNMEGRMYHYTKYLYQPDYWYTYCDIRQNGVDPYFIGLRANGARMARRSALKDNYLLNNVSYGDVNIADALPLVEKVLKEHGRIRLVVALTRHFKGLREFCDGIIKLAEKYAIAFDVYRSPGYASSLAYDTMHSRLYPYASKFKSFTFRGSSDSPGVVAPSELFKYKAPKYSGLILKRGKDNRTFATYVANSAETTVGEFAKKLGVSVSKVFVPARETSAPLYLVAINSQMMAMTTERLPSVGRYSGVLAATTANRKLRKGDPIVVLHDTRSIWPPLLANRTSV